MESNIKGLVSAGHEMASELKAECGAVDMRSVAKLISDLATQLEVQLVRANAQAEDQQKAIESIKQADSAVKLAHEKFSALAAENAGIKSAIPESRDIEDDNDNMDDVSLAEDFGFNHAIELMRRRIPETPATDAFLAEVRAEARNEGINYTASRLAAAFNHGFINKSLREVFDVTRMILSAKEELANEPHPLDGLSGEYAEKSLEEWAEQIRKGSSQ
ncbi:TPA: ead/Ea22-like family protein [Escherichia coli]|nr:ead/Ea22-like family protein [Escherichia coli]